MNPGLSCNLLKVQTVKSTKSIYEKCLSGCKENSAYFFLQVPINTISKAKTTLKKF